MEEFFGAGILFISESGNSVLTGFHPKLNRWSGFGGKRRGTELALETAVREVIEELFGVFSLSSECFSEIMSCIESTPQNEGGYMLFIETEKTIFMLSDILIKHQCYSDYYVNIPMNNNELVSNRFYLETMEIQKIEYFPLINLQDMRGSITDEFYSDIQSYLLLSELSSHEYNDMSLTFFLNELGTDI